MLAQNAELTKIHVPVLFTVAHHWNMYVRAVKLHACKAMTEGTVPLNYMKEILIIFVGHYLQLRIKQQIHV